MHIRVDDLTHPAVQALLREHLAGMHAQSPPESVHALGLDRLRAPDITFWAVWEDENLLGCGALRQLDDRHGELKSMRTAQAHLRRGVGSALLTHILDEARRRGLTRLSLETGSTPGFDPARRLYARFGFTECGPFADYAEDPFSVFMTRSL
ncbi:MAG: GNAT family N-acetyltransferase [Burkholderiaceae bacterium]|nr:GNAT family N-acetyltransferase [Burkholderiaceae bacterium]